MYSLLTKLLLECHIFNFLSRLLLKLCSQLTNCWSLGIKKLRNSQSEYFIPQYSYFVATMFSFHSSNFSAIREKICIRQTFCHPGIVQVLLTFGLTRLEFGEEAFQSSSAPIYFSSKPCVKKRIGSCCCENILKTSISVCSGSSDSISFNFLSASADTRRSTLSVRFMALMLILICSRRSEWCEKRFRREGERLVNQVQSLVVCCSWCLTICINEMQIDLQHGVVMHQAINLREISISGSSQHQNLIAALMHLNWLKIACKSNNVH